MTPIAATVAQHATSTLDWVAANHDALLTGSIVAAGLVGVMLVARAIGHRLQAGDPRGSHWRGVIGRVLARTTIIFMVVAAIDIVTSYADPPRKSAHLADVIFTVVAAIQAAIWARELILGVIARRVGEEPGETTLGNASAIIRVLVSVVLFALAIVVILDNLGVNVTALVAGLGIGGIAIGLAAQGIFADLFAALSIVFDRPFRRGDTIRFGTTIGTVERIGLKTTRLRALSGELVIMANTKLLEQEISNLAASRQRRVTLAFALAYSATAAALAELETLTRPLVEAQPGCRLVRCLATGMGASGIEVELVYDDGQTDNDALARHKAGILVALVGRLADAGLAIAYPTQTTFTAAPDGSLVMPYASPPITHSPS